MVRSGRERVCWMVSLDGGYGAVRQAQEQAGVKTVGRARVARPEQGTGEVQGGEAERGGRAAQAGMVVGLNFTGGLRQGFACTGQAYDRNTGRSGQASFTLHRLRECTVRCLTVTGVRTGQASSGASKHAMMAFRTELRAHDDSGRYDGSRQGHARRATGDRVALDLE